MVSNCSIPDGKAVANNKSASKGIQLALDCRWQALLCPPSSRLVVAWDCDTANVYDGSAFQQLVDQFQCWPPTGEVEVDRLLMVRSVGFVDVEAHTARSQRPRIVVTRYQHLMIAQGIRCCADERNRAGLPAVDARLDAAQLVARVVAEPLQAAEG
jgi:hypothetical protein